MANTKKFNEFIEERYPQSGDYMVGYRIIDDEEFRIPLGYLGTTIISNSFIRKDIDDYANGVITFNSGLKTAGDVYSTIYTQGLNGWFIDKEGNLEVNSITARGFIETPELRKNRITVMGNQFWFTDSAHIKSVTATGNSQYDVYFRLEVGEYGSFALDDIVKGIFHYDTGFYTVYLRVFEEILDEDGGQLGVRMVALNNRAPMAGMIVARMNNFTNEDRRGSIFVDGLKKFLRVLDGFDENNPTSEGGKDTLKVQLGDLSTITNTPFGVLDGYGLYAENVFLTGRIQIKNDPKAEGQILGVFRGQWVSTIGYFAHDQVSYKGSLYSSKLNNNLNNTPVGDSTDVWWDLVVAQGPAGAGLAAAIMDITNDNTVIPTNFDGLYPIISDPTEGLIHKCAAHVYQGATDISSLYDFSHTVDNVNIITEVQSAADPYRIAIKELKNTNTWESATITLIATPKDALSGYAPLSTVWTIGLVRAGSPGENTTAYWMVTDASVIKRFKNGTFSPNPFIARARAKTGEDPIVDFNGYWRLSYGTTSLTSSGTTLQFVPLPTVTTYTIELFYDAALSILLDKEIINTVEDGQDGGAAVEADWQIFIFYRGTAAPNTPIFTKPPTAYPISGWYDYPNVEGIWWMSTAVVDGPTQAISSWSKPVRMVGIDGDNGSYYINVYISSATQPSIPLGSTIPPEYWSLYPTAPTDTSFTWMSQTVISPDGSVGPWSTPIRISGLNGEDGVDGTDVEWIFSRTSANVRPSTPGGDVPVQIDDYVPSGWTDDPVGPTLLDQYEWTAVRYKVDGLWTVFSTPSLWARFSTDGIDGTDVEWIFIRSETNVRPSTPGTSQTDDYVPPGGWTDDPVGPNVLLPYEWSSVRYKVAGYWGDFSTPSLWARWSKDGVDGGDGNSIEMRFAVSGNSSIAPSLATGSRNPAGWTVAPPGVGLDQYLWMTKATISSANALIGTWSAPVRVSGEAGLDAYNINLSSPAGVLLADPISGVIIGNLASTQLSVRTRTTVLTRANPGSLGAGSFSAVITENNGLVYSESGAVGAQNVIYNVTGFTNSSATSGSLTIFVNCEGQSYSYITYTVTKVKNGEDGGSGNTVEFRYAVNTSNTTAPSLTTGTRNPAGWTVQAPARTTSQYLWMTQATISSANALVGAWAAPTCISGSNGADGTGTEFVFRRSTSTVAPSIPATSQTDGYVPEYWTDNPIGVTSTYPYEWVVSRSKVNGVWTNFSSPALWARWSADGTNGTNGVDGGRYVSIYYSSATQPSTPGISGHLIPPLNWSLTPTAVTDTVFLWMSTSFVSSSNTVSGWSTPIRISGPNGAKGVDGTDIEFIFYRTATDTKPATPGGTTAVQQNDYVPSPWTDNAVGPNATYPYEWVSNRSKNAGTWTVFSAPSMWARWSADGEDGENGTPVGENILMGSGFADRTGISSNNSATQPITKTEMSDGTRNFVRVKRASGTDTTNFSVYNAISLSNLNQSVAGKKITISCDARASQNVNATFMRSVISPASSTHLANVPLTTEWKRYYWTLDVPSNVTSGFRFIPYLITTNPMSITVDYSRWAVKFGELEDEWSPAWTDLEAYNVGLTSYAGALSWDRPSYISGGDPRNNLTFSVFAKQGTTSLVRKASNTTPPGPGEYYMSVVNSAGVSSSVSTAPSAEILVYGLGSPYLSGTITVTINCESRITYTCIYSITNVVDAPDSSMLDWIADWDGNSVLIDGKRVISPRIFTGSITAGKATGVALGRNAITIGGVNKTGLYGVKDGALTFALDVDGSAWFYGTVAVGNTTFINPNGTGWVQHPTTLVKNFQWDSLGNVSFNKGIIGGFTLDSRQILYTGSIDSTIQTADFKLTPYYITMATLATSSWGSGKRTFNVTTHPQYSYYGIGTVMFIEYIDSSTPSYNARGAQFEVQRTNPNNISTSHGTTIGQTLTINTNGINSTTTGQEISVKANPTNYSVFGQNIYVDCTSTSGTVTGCNINLYGTISTSLTTLNSNIGLNITISPVNSIAIQCVAGRFRGFRPFGRSMSATGYLDRNDTVIFWKALSHVPLYLPSSPYAGQMYIIKKFYNGNCIITVSNTNHKIQNGWTNNTAPTNTSVTLTEGSACIILWDEDTQRWTSNYLPEF